MRLWYLLHRGSQMNAHVLLNIFNELRKSEKIGGLPNILSFFCNEFDKFNNTGARMLDSIYHMTLKLLNNRKFTIKTSRFYHLFRYYDGRHYVTLLNL